MKSNWIVAVMLLIIVSTLSACGTKGKGTDESYMAAVQGSNEKVSMAAMSYFENQSKLDAQVFEKLENNETAAVLYAMASKEKGAKILENLPVQKIEKPTNGYDTWNVFLSQTVPTGIRWGAGAFIGNGLIDALSAPTYQLIGDGSNFLFNKDSSGSMFDHLFSSPSSELLIPEGEL